MNHRGGTGFVFIFFTLDQCRRPLLAISVKPGGPPPQPGRAPPGNSCHRYAQDRSFERARCICATLRLDCSRLGRSTACSISFTDAPLQLVQTSSQITVVSLSRFNAFFSAQRCVVFVFKSLIGRLLAPHETALTNANRLTSYALNSRSCMLVDGPSAFCMPCV